MDFSTIFNTIASNPQVFGGGTATGFFVALGLAFLAAQANKKKKKK